MIQAIILMKKMQKPTSNKVSILIATLDTFSYLRDCIEAIEKNTKIPHEIIVLDLGDDGTSYWCKEKKIPVYQKELPFFFSQSMNFLASKAHNELLLFLNSDTVPQKNFLEEMINEMNASESDIVGARMMYPNGTIQSSGLEWENLELQPEDKGFNQRMSPVYLLPRDAQIITAACMLVSKTVFRKIGGFDEKFKNGYEDVDFCFRAKNMDYKIRFCGRAEVTHFHGMTGGTHGDQGILATSKEYYDDNLKLLQKKYRPVDYTSKIKTNYGKWKSRVLIGTPTTGTVRVEWTMARYGQVIPTNWSSVEQQQLIPDYAPMRYLVPDAQNLIVKRVIEEKFEWLILIEQDNLLPPDAFVRFNDYMNKYDIPVISGLYFTKSVPPEPLIYREWGQSYVKGWKMGDKVWARGVPTGCLLIHSSLLEKMWQESPEYLMANIVTRRVFEAPARVWFDPDLNGIRTSSGTSDLDWCGRVVKNKIFAKAGWSKYQDMEYPFLVDTNIFCQHITNDGIRYPLEIPKEFIK